jgi:hypothetical protein
VTTHPGWGPDGRADDPWAQAHPAAPNGGPVPYGPAAPPPVAPQPHRRRTRLVVIAAAVLAVLATVAGVFAQRTLASGPDSPQDVAETFMSAALRHDWRASWDLLCRSAQLDYGSVDRYVMVKAGAAALIGWSDTRGVTATVGEARPHGGSGPPSYVLDVQLSRAGETHDVQLIVVQEDDEFRVCGQP